jgi:hypothetical protein
MKALFVLVCVGIGKDGFGRYVLAEQETLTQGSLKWPAIGARGHPQIRSTFCFPAQDAGRNGITVRDRSTNSLYSSDYFIISGSQVVTFRRWRIQSSSLS